MAHPVAGVWARGTSRPACPTVDFPDLLTTL